MKKSKAFLAIGLTVLGLTGVATLGVAQSLTAEEIRLARFLQEFQNNPREVMNRRVVKRSPRGRVVREQEPLFSYQDIVSGDFVAAKNFARDNICSDVTGALICVRDIRPGRAAFTRYDNAKELVDSGDEAVVNLAEMGRMRLHSGSLAESPWSDTYWPLYMGATSLRYADESFPRSTSWKENFDYSAANSVASILGSADNASAIDSLSPAEKYDLLVGDTAGTLAAANWQMGNAYYADDHKVETWMGLCHGWAAASYMLPRPKKAFEVLAADGVTKIRFYPSDVKALATLLWAEGNTGSQRFVGGRCNSKEPAVDQASGRVTSEECFDTNPGTWHIAVVNQIGVSKRSMVMDATFDYEVWNQPVYRYRYSYFNPQTKQPVRDLRSARVSKEEFVDDKFKKFRAEAATTFVGVQMTVEYGVETSPTHSATDSADYDGTREVSYQYDLELNDEGNILGGEWYTNLHPDFLWTPTPDARAVSIADRYVRGEWTPGTRFPEAWGRIAARASAAGQPLAKVVDALIAASVTAR